ncbi:MAG TPA: CBS domain-containing protein [Methanomicrobiales archaeon]|jgi:CBS domain-containing protein|nr:CBS domain-containing protein [Methanomicrobiales archaeon]
MKTAGSLMVKVPVLSLSDHITRARQILRDDIFREVYVQDEKKHLAGYVDITDALRITDTRSNITVEGFLQEAVRVSPGDSLEKVAAVLRDAKTDSAAVVDGQGAVLGAVLLSEIFPILITKHELRGTVGDWMSRHVVTAEAREPIQKIYTLIMESGFTAFPVVSKKQLVGIVSRHDLIRAGRVRKAFASPANVEVESVMTTEIITVTPGTSAPDAAALLVKHDISRMPVMDAGKIAGIIDRHDLLRGLIFKQ